MGLPERALGRRKGELPAGCRGSRTYKRRGKRLDPHDSMKINKTVLF